SIGEVRSARSFLIEGDLTREQAEKIAAGFLVDTVVETHEIHLLSAAVENPKSQIANPKSLLNVLYKPGVTDNVADSIKAALLELGHSVSAVRSCQKYWFAPEASSADLERVAAKVLANDAIQQVIWGPLHLGNMSLGTEYRFRHVIVPIWGMSDEQLLSLSRDRQLYLSLREMQTIRQ